MPFKPGQSGNVAGKSKGTKNKKTVAVLQVIQNVFDNIGGEAEFTLWAKAHKDLFYTSIYTKILPKNIEVEVSGKDGGAIIINYPNGK